MFTGYLPLLAIGNRFSWQAVFVSATEKGLGINVAGLFACGDYIANKPGAFFKVDFSGDFAFDVCGKVC